MNSARNQLLSDDGEHEQRDGDRNHVIAEHRQALCPDLPVLPAPPWGSRLRIRVAMTASPQGCGRGERSGGSRRVPAQAGLRQMSCVEQSMQRSAAGQRAFCEQYIADLVTRGLITLNADRLRYSPELEQPLRPSFQKIAEVPCRLRHSQPNLGCNFCNSLPLGVPRLTCGPVAGRSQTSRLDQPRVSLHERSYFAMQAQ